MRCIESPKLKLVFVIAESEFVVSNRSCCGVIILLAAAAVNVCKYRYFFFNLIGKRPFMHCGHGSSSSKLE